MKLGLGGSKQDPYYHKINKQALFKGDGGPIVAQKKRKRERERERKGKKEGRKEEMKEKMRSKLRDKEHAGQ